MFFYISKIFTFLLMPYTQMFIWFLLSIILKSRKWKRVFFILGIFYLIFFSNRFIVNEALLLWEVSPTPIEHVPGNYETGIVLGGVTNSEKEPRDRVYLYRGADRITHAVQLYKLGKIKKILVSGGSSNLINTEHKEAHNLHRFLLLCGVDENDILVEDQARNTYENAIFSADLIRKMQLEDKAHLMITSAYHLKRALLCFEATSLKVDGFSTDFYGKERKFTPDRVFIPDPTAFADWQKIIRELEGLLFYKMMGYI